MDGRFMGATIDNLEAHFRYRVIRGFTDAMGKRVPFDATGIIRRIDLNMPEMTEIYIDWEREGPDGVRTAERLTFLLAAKEGPGNGRMKQYFERGDLVMPPRAPKTAAPREGAAAGPDAAPPAPPARSLHAPSLPALGAQPPEQEVALGDRRVACDCEASFHRPIFPDAHLMVSACLRCGTVTVTRQVGDDGRFTGKAWTAYCATPIPDELVDWLGGFPRVAVDYGGAIWRWPMSASLVRYPRLFYPAGTRVKDAAELAGLEEQLWSNQSPLTRAGRLRSVLQGLPDAPSDLPDAFSTFASVRRALDLSPASDLETLKAHAHLLSRSCEIAADLLIRRWDAYDTMMTWLRSDRDDDFSAGIAMLRDSRPLFSGPEDERLARPLLEILNALPLGPLKDVPGRVESCQRFEALLVAIADLCANSKEMRAGLASLMKKLAPRDSYTAEAIRLVLNELQGIDNRPQEARSNP